jgi:hypothetical protein
VSGPQRSTSLIAALSVAELVTQLVAPTTTLKGRYQEDQGYLQEIGQEGFPATVREESESSESESSASESANSSAASSDAVRPLDDGLNEMAVEVPAVRGRGRLVCTKLTCGAV